MDTSGYAVGAVLTQQIDADWKLVYFLLRSMTEAERNYDIYDKELLSVMFALTECRYYSVVWWERLVLL
jgi:hypothetical protein